MAKFGFEQRFIDGVPVVLGNDLRDTLKEYAEQNSAGGAVGAVYEDEYLNIADDVCDCIKRSQPIYKFCVKQNASGEEGDVFAAIPEHARHIVAIGGERAAERAKRAAERYGVGWGAYVATPCCDSVLEEGQKPTYVLLDKEALNDCPQMQVAAARGSLYSLPLRGFEKLFAEKVLAQTVAVKEVDVSSAVDNAELAFAVLQANARRDFCDGASDMAKLLRAAAISAGRKPRLFGEYKYLSAYALTVFYNVFLGALPIDIMPPANLGDAIDAYKKLKADFYCGAKKVDFFDRNSYFKISYLLGEYRLDLLERLKACDVRQYQRQWRRTYPDAGYWMKSEISCNDLFIALALAGAKSDGLLGFAYASGALRRFEEAL